jgi:excinuclease ABC subunit C
MAIHDLKGQIGRLPQQPGVYLFLNASGETLYVGKARVLRERVRSYLAALGMSPRIDALLGAASALEVIVTDSVVEALALENRLIKQRNPRFNILLRDDKTYPYLQLTLTEPAPRLLVARRVERDGNVYAGPFMPAAVARRTMSLAHKLFGIRSCNEVIDGNRPRPCLEYDIGRCLAPCVAAICSLDEYRRAAEQARLLIEGRQDELVSGLSDEMREAAATERFERAAHLRDAIKTIETLRDRHNKVESPAMGDRDAFGIKLGTAGAVVQVFQMRRGRVVERTELVTDPGALGSPEPAATPAVVDDAVPGLTECDVLQAALQQFYSERQAPPEVHIPVPFDDEEQAAIEAWLSSAAGRRVRLLTPQRGEKRGLVDLAARNAALAYQSHFGEGATTAYQALETLREVLHLPTLPRRIECFDISTFQGRETVASMVVAFEGRMRRSEYRKFRISLATPDDFTSMHEVVLRRYRRLLSQGGPFPDLIVIDGGKGQLTAAYTALAELGLERLVADGIAKQEELLFTRDRADGIALPAESHALRLVQRIRDEAHRFAVTFHRRARTMRDFRSELDEVTGIGARRRRQLLTAFGSVAGVKRASRAELASVVGAKAADAVLRHFAEDLGLKA